MLNYLVIFFIVILLIGIVQTKENFIVFIDDHNPPKSHCPEYLLTDGENYYIHDSRKFPNAKTNPMKFKTLDEANKHLENNKCPKLDVINLVQKKSNNDPTVNYERECAKHIAGFNHRLDGCINYSKTIDETRKYQSLLDNDMMMNDFDLETCMSRKIMKENPSMKKNTDIEYLDELFKFVN